MIAQPTTAIFQSQEILRPFLLAANYPVMGYRSPSIVIGAMQCLVEGYATQPADVMHVVRVLWIQVNVCMGALGTAAASAPGVRGGGAGHGWERGPPRRAGNFAVAGQGGGAGEGGHRGD